MLKLGDVIMILDLAREGLSISAIARRTGLDRKTVRRAIARGVEPPAYKPRPPRQTLLGPYEAYLRERVAAFPELTGARLLREVRELGYKGCYTAVTTFLQEVRPDAGRGFERRFETPPGRQAQSLPRRKPGWTSRSSRPSSPTSPAWSGWSGCSPWCWATAA